ncbi:ribonucleoside-diphosphate reductase subunit alpha [Cognatishimia sp.]|uniref:ribonucleoside-diphosphate reductase subunit alpha n=1 Tax=Cognatishimia sp. TaxID=2211648 RepID=UPI0035189D2C|nr:ribonucleoside-diphosphate reductase subunit alpha [Cognatishimia sp.]
MKIIDALDKGDLDLARDILLSNIYEQVEDKNSWHSPNYNASDKVKKIQKNIILDSQRDKLLTFFGLQVLTDRYFLRGEDGNVVETPQKFFSRVASGLCDGDEKFAQQLYDAISKLWFMPATPILTNISTDKGSLISCFLQYMGDSIKDIYKTVEECAFLGSGGGGLGVYMGDIRGQGATIKKTMKSSGTIPFMNVLDANTLAITQGGVRRASAAIYLDISHPDIEEFVDLRKPTGGDENRRCLNLHHGVNITDTFMEAVKNHDSWDLICPHSGKIVKTISAFDLWVKILTNRVSTGEPYIHFIDTTNRAILPEHEKRDLFVKQSNLCSEITLPTDEDRTAVCCLGSINLEQCPETLLSYVSGLATEALDNVLSIFIDKADKRNYKRAINSASKERSIGLGLMGWHGYLMKNKIPFEGIQAISKASTIQEIIQKAAKNKSEELAIRKGDCEDNPGYRNSYLTAIAPTANISVIAGGATPCIEPIAGNAYLQKTLSGSFLVKNKYLEELLESKGRNTRKVWKSITRHKGSVQHLEFLSEEEKRLFKTAYELDQRFIVRQAGARQKHLCQSQSLNLFFAIPDGGLPAKYLNEVHLIAHNLGVKSLYYLRSESVLGFKIDYDECVACQ